VNTKPDVTQLQLRTVLPWIVAVVLLAVAPYLAAWALAPVGQVFTGALINPNDLSVYLSALRQGARGEWLFHFAFSPEPIPPRLTYPLYLLTGKLIPPSGDSGPILFHALRAAMVVVALIGLVYWVRCALPGRTRTQLTAWLLIVFGGGFGWLLAPIVNDRLLIPDLSVPEWGGFMALFHTPHFALGLGLEAMLFGALLQMTQPSSRWRSTILASTLALIAGLIYPYNIPVIGLIIGVYVLTRTIREPRGAWREWSRGTILLAPLSALLLYYGVEARSDPYWELTHVSNNIVSPPLPLGIVIGFGLTGVLALIGGWRWMRHEGNWLAPTWAIVNLLALYVPVPFSGRFALGLAVPIGTLAAYGLEQVVLATRTSGRSGLARRMAIGLGMPSVLTLLILRSVLLPREFPYYLPAAEVRAAEWLAQHSDANDLILAYHPMGNYLPRVIDGRVFVGQLYLTVSLNEKLRLVERFWDEETPAAWRERFVREWGITHIYQGQHEQGITVGKVIPPGEIVYHSEGVTIYEVGAP